MKKRKSFGKKGGGASQDVPLQITSMADIFTIILVFLLKSYNSGGMAVQPSAGLKLPMASTESQSPQALTVEISEKAVQVDNKLIVPLENFRFNAKDLLASGVAGALNEEMEKQRKRQDLIAKSNSDVNSEAKIMIVADQRVPFVTLKSVISTTAIHGYSDLKLVVMQKE